MSDLKITNTAFLQNYTFIPLSENTYPASKSTSNESIQRSLQSPSHVYEIPGVKSQEEWAAFLAQLDLWNNLSNDYSDYKEFKERLEAAFQTLASGTEVPDYKTLLSYLELLQSMPSSLNTDLLPDENNTQLIDLINAVKTEYSTLETYAKTQIDQQLPLLTSVISELEASLSKTLSEKQKQAVLQLISDLTKQKKALENIKQNSADTDLFKQFCPFEMSIKKSLEEAKKLLETIDISEEDSTTPSIPNIEIPLEEGESVRNQTGRKGLGSHTIGLIGGTVAYLQAYYAFNKTCNKLITMNASWGVALSSLQRDASQLNISCQNAIAGLIKEATASLDDDNKDTVPHTISDYQNRANAVQLDFAAYQKGLDSIMPLILEQPKDITKDLDKFLEAAKSILQMITAYANFRI